MIKISLSGKRITQGVIHTDQFANDAKVIEFTLDDYTQEDGAVDLKDATPQIVTSINGVIDVVEPEFSIESRKVIITWSLSDHLLLTPGVITYQIRFVREDSTVAWFTYKANIVNRVSIDGENYMSANYPTLMKQWLDLMHTLSGSFGSEIVYMSAGNPIPVEERLAGRLYYQWLETPTTNAKCAVGTVNLGARPYADSGLYINNKHIYVDDTSDAAFVLEPQVWVDTINNANCGVFASNISSSEEIILLITAKNAGASGNSIGLKLGVAAYGLSAGENNPSNGSVSGSTLAGGFDSVSGVETPLGRFEDSNGNVLSIQSVGNGNMATITNEKGVPVASDKISVDELNMLDGVRGNIQEQIDSKNMVPDYSRRFSIQSGYVAEYNGFVVGTGSSTGTMTITVADYTFTHNHSTLAGAAATIIAPVCKGDTCSCTACATFTFIPCKNLGVE